MNDETVARLWALERQYDEPAERLPPPTGAGTEAGELPRAIGGGATEERRCVIDAA